MVNSIEINATKEKVWDVLWSDQTFRDWSSIIDEGTYYTGTFAEGEELVFIGSSEGGVRYGVINKVESLVPFNRVELRQIADIKIDSDGVVHKREKQWEGGLEIYEIKDGDNGKVVLSLKQDVPDELVELFEIRVPRALERIKYLAERE